MENFDFSMNPNYKRSPQMDYFRSKVQATVSGIKKRVQHTPQQKAWCRCGKKNPLFSVNRAGLPNN